METSHKFGILAARLGLFPRETRPDPPSLRTTVWGREFPNPLGGLGCRRTGAWGRGQLAGMGLAGLVRERAMAGLAAWRCCRLAAAAAGIRHALTPRYMV